MIIHLKNLYCSVNSFITWVLVSMKASANSRVLYTIAFEFQHFVAESKMLVQSTLAGLLNREPHVKEASFSCFRIIVLTGKCRLTNVLIVE